MILLELYKRKNRDANWKKQFSSLSKNGKGKFFSYTNTNFRTIKSFISQFQHFEKIENLPRSEWPRANYKQERDKHRVVNMLSAKLFKKEYTENKEEKYGKTKKGIAYKKFAENNELSENEKWIINYIMLMNGYYGYKENSIKQQTSTLWEEFLSLNAMNKELLYDYLLHSIKTTKAEKIFTQDFFYLHSFYNDYELLELYFNSSNQERKKLHSYIINNWTRKNDKCCISKKYKQGGNYNKSMFVDDCKVFFLTLKAIDMEEQNLKNVLKSIIKEYKNIENSINENDVNSFLHTDFEIVEVVLADFYQREEDVEIVLSPEIEEETAPEEYIDDTTKIGKKEILQKNQSKKKIAKENAGYKCSLEELNNCKYFTNKKTRRHYVEVHHLIPRQFSNEFSQSIEVTANYICLCPHCHEMIHKAVDGERKPCINYLYSKRKEKLESLKIQIKLEQLYDYYNIEEI